MTPIEELREAVNGNGKVTHYAHRGRVEMDESVHDKLVKGCIALIEIADLEKEMTIITSFEIGVNKTLERIHSIIERNLKA